MVIYVFIYFKKIVCKKRLVIYTILSVAPQLGTKNIGPHSGKISFLVVVPIMALEVIGKNKMAEVRIYSSNKLNLPDI